MSTKPRRKFGHTPSDTIGNFLESAVTLDQALASEPQDTINESPRRLVPTPPDAHGLRADDNAEDRPSSLPRVRSGRRFFGNEESNVSHPSETKPTDLFTLMLQKIDNSDGEDSLEGDPVIVQTPPPAQAAPNVTIPSEMMCPVCLDPFDSPVTLACNHNVCKGHILDLAAADGDVYTGPNEYFSVRCPKCRTSTTFADGEKSIHVNHEMNAVLQMILQLLSKGSGASLDGGVLKEPIGPVQPPSPRGLASSSSMYHPNPSDVAPPALRSRSQSASNLKVARSKRVRFEGDDTDTESKGTRPTTPSHSDGGNLDGGADIPSPAKTPTSATRHRQHIKKAQQQLQTLEKQLELQREKLKSDREEVARQKEEDYKKARQEEINRRKQLILLEMQVEEELAEAVSPVPKDGKPIRALPSIDASEDSKEEKIWSVAEAQFLAVKRQREQQREQERHERERVVQAQIDAWRKKDYPIISSVDGGELERHLREINLYSSGNIALTQSAKAKVAEAATERLYHENKLQQQVPPPNPPPSKNTTWTKEDNYDDEVERKLWEVELKVNRERDEELSRAKMAEIAEQRARATIAAYLGNAARKPLTPSYTPKLHRLQKL